MTDQTTTTTTTTAANMTPLHREVMREVITTTDAGPGKVQRVTVRDHALVEPADIPAGIPAMLAYVRGSMTPKMRTRWDALFSQDGPGDNRRSRAQSDMPGTVFGSGALHKPPTSAGPSQGPRAAQSRVVPDGEVRLARSTVPGMIRTRTIVQLPAEDARDMSGNSLIYGFGLRTLMAAGAATRRTANTAIRTGRVNPHDPLDVARWALERRGKYSSAATIAGVAIAARRVRETIKAAGFDVTAAGMSGAELPNGPGEQTQESAQLWADMSEAIEVLAGLAPAHLAELSGMLGSGDLDQARAWVRHNMQDTMGR